MSLRRVLEAEVMDTVEEALDYNALDHRAVNQVFTADFLAAARGAGLLPAATAAGSSESPPDADDPPDWLDVLDLGTGTSLIPIAICQACERVRVVAADAAMQMLYLARNNIEIAGLRERIRPECQNAKALEYADGFFRAVISNSIVHHIPEPRDMLAEATRVLAPGGLLMVRDLLRPESDEQVRHFVAMYAADANDHGRAMFDASLRAALRLSEIRGLVWELGFAPEGVQPTSDRHWTWTAVQR